MGVGGSVNILTTCNSILVACVGLLMGTRYNFPVNGTTDTDQPRNCPSFSMALLIGIALVPDIPSSEP